MSAPTLRPYQGDGLDATAASLEKGLNRVLLKAPTGTGKTVMFAAALEHPPIKKWLSQFPAGHRRMLVIAHREELLDQAARKIQAANPDLIVCVEQADRYAVPGADVVCGSIQTLAARGFTRLRRLMTSGDFRVVIVDEAHHAAALTYRGALACLGFLPPPATPLSDALAELEDVPPAVDLDEWDRTAPKDRLLVGVTATPNRSDAVGLGCVFQTIAYSYGLRKAIDDGWLVPITAWSVETQDSLDEVRVSHGEFNQRDLADAVNNARRNELAVAAWHEHAYDQSTLAFTVDVAHAHALAQAFTRHGIRAAAVSGETPKDERRLLLEQFSAGEVKVLCNCMVLTEGTDLPVASCILHAKPTKSATLYEQMTGRGLRIHPRDPAGPLRLESPGPFIKSQCVVIDLVDVARRHSLQQAPVLYGLPPQIKAKGEKLDEVADEWEELLEKYPTVDVDALLDGKSLTLAEFAAAAERVDIWRELPLGTFAEGRELEWMKQGEDLYRLEYPWLNGHECITVRKDLIDKWEVVVSYRVSGQAHATVRTIAASVLSSDAAAAVAEGFVAQERTSVTRMLSVHAGWKARPISDKQKAWLQRHRVPFDPRRMTAGQASRLMTTWFMRKGRS